MKGIRRKKILKCIGAGLILCIGVSLVTGCNGKGQTVDYDVEGETESAKGGSTGKTDVAQFASVPKWEDEWTSVNTKDNDVLVHVEADITVPDTAQMSVVAVEEPEFDADYKKRVAECIFGGGDIYYNDISHLPRKELEERRTACQEAYDSYPEANEEQREALEKELADYDEALETAIDAYTLADAFDAEEYLGKHGGVEYELYFAESERCYDAWDNLIECRGKEIGITAADVREVCPKAFSEAGNLTYWASKNEMYGENQCAISVEEAQELAQNFVDELDLDYPICTSYLPIAWAEAINDYQIENSGIVDGYVFYFDAGVDGLSFVRYGAQENYRTFSKKKDSEESRYSMKAQMEVFVTEKGVIEMHAYNPIEITGTSGNVGLAPLEDIKAIMKERITENIGFFRLKYSEGDWMLFNDMELIYFRIRDKENPGHYSYVPTWRLSNVYGREESKLSWAGYDAYRIDLISPVLVNAIDGTVIDFFDEV